MPYINKWRRRTFNYCCDRIASQVANPGELNYVFTRIIRRITRGESPYGGLDYTTLNSIVGVLESVKREFQRQVVDPYEEAKRVENGDLFIDETTDDWKNYDSDDYSGVPDEHPAASGGPAPDRPDGEDGGGQVNGSGPDGPVRVRPAALGSALARSGDSPIRT